MKRVIRSMKNQIIYISLDKQQQQQQWNQGNFNTWNSNLVRAVVQPAVRALKKD